MLPQLDREFNSVLQFYIIIYMQLYTNTYTFIPQK